MHPEQDVKLPLNLFQITLTPSFQTAKPRRYNYLVRFSKMFFRVGLFNYSTVSVSQYDPSVCFANLTSSNILHLSLNYNDSFLIMLWYGILRYFIHPISSTQKALKMREKKMLVQICAVALLNGTSPAGSAAWIGIVRAAYGNLDSHNNPWM